jgi:hypothetical protein
MARKKHLYQYQDVAFGRFTDANHALLGLFENPDDPAKRDWREVFGIRTRPSPRCGPYLAHDLIRPRRHRSTSGREAR